MSSLYSIEIGTEQDIPFIAQSQVDMAHETEGMTLDLQTVLKGAQHLFDEPWRGFYIIAHENGRRKPVACLLVLKEWSDWRNADIWWIHSVYVIPPARRQGLFRQMFNFVETKAREQNVQGIRLYVDKTNTNAQAVYQSIGMTKEHYELFEKMLDSYISDSITSSDGIAL